MASEADKHEVKLRDGDIAYVTSFFTGASFIKPI